MVGRDLPVPGSGTHLGDFRLTVVLLGMNGVAGLKGWQWMFLIEALPAFLLGIVVLFYMTDRPEKAKWLADDERAWLVETMNAERPSWVKHRHGMPLDTSAPDMVAIAGAGSGGLFTRLCD